MHGSEGQRTRGMIGFSKRMAVNSYGHKKTSKHNIVNQQTKQTTFHTSLAQGTQANTQN